MKAEDLNPTDNNMLIRDANLYKNHPCYFQLLFALWLFSTSLTKHEVKMAGYCSFFACLWTEMESRSINSQKQELDQYQAILNEKAWSMQDLL